VIPDGISWEETIRVEVSDGLDPDEAIELRSSCGPAVILAAHHELEREAMRKTGDETCLLCGSADARAVCEFPEFTWVRCGCGLIYKRGGGESGVEYNEDYFVNRENIRRPYSAREGRRVRKSRSQILDVLNHVAPGPLLDLGCSLGYTLQAASDLGLAATGVDISEHAVTFCRERGFRAELGTLHALPFPDAAFQLVIVKHVLEHTAKPREALREISRVLRPGGGLFLAVPHGGYFKARVNPAASRHFRPEVHGTEHFVYYVPATLARLLREESFDPVGEAHPQLIHRRAGAVRMAAEIAIAPLRFAAQRARSLASLDKEFWVTAVRL
jgi:SAM-dependent methyltransferase